MGFYLNKVNMNSKLTLIFSLILTFVSATWSQNAPLLVWTSEDLSHCSPQIEELRPELPITSVFTGNYVDCLKQKNTGPDNIITFNVEPILDEETLLKFLQSLSNVQKFIKEYGFSIPSIKSDHILDDIELIAGSEFPESKFTVEYIETGLELPLFHEIDVQVTNKVQNLNGSFVAILYTSIKLPSFDMHTGRHLLQASSNEPTKNTTYCIIGSCVQMCFSSLKYGIKDSVSSTNFTTSSFSFDSETGTCDATNEKTTPVFVSVTKTFSDDATGKNIQLKMTFEQKKWEMSGEVFWALSGVDVDNNTLSSRTFYPGLSAPASWSFGCASPQNFTDSKPTATRNYLEFQNLYLQAFIKDSTEFQPRMLDCSGWFTGPIWVGLLVSLLLITMLSYAYGMIGSITTMDKFDNPKGKTISVPQES